MLWPKSTGKPTGLKKAYSATPFEQQPVTSLKRVGPKVAERLAKLGIFTLQDLLFHLPLRYQDHTRVHPIGSLRPGAQLAVEGEVEGWR